MAVCDLHRDLRGGTGFDPRERSYMKHVYHYSDLEGEAGVVWTATVVVRQGAKAVVHCHSWGELDGAKVNPGRSTAQ